ncbi:MAG: DUF1330 domain-containing protein [Alphaproteobacteria bacterium]|nr:DUF1330 domain-containing protein [Alphaproteobacteria bacterium]
MPGYVIATVDVDNPETYALYRRDVPATIARHGGRFLVRGGALEVMEGAAARQRVVVIEFPSVTAAHTWYRSPEYQAILPLRHRASRADVIIVEGAAPD